MTLWHRNTESPPPPLSNENYFVSDLFLKIHTREVIKQTNCDKPKMATRDLGICKPREHRAFYTLHQVTWLKKYSSIKTVKN
jgi:hypothetical protein